MDFLGEFRTVKFSHTFKNRLKNYTFRVIADILCG